MKKINFILIALLALAFSTSVSAQDEPSYSKIIKNVNPNAKDLYHELNASKDSLLLRHDEEQILRVSFMSHKGKNNKKKDFGKNQVSVSLDGLGIGRYTVAVYLSGGQVVVHGLVRILPIPAKKLKKNAEDLRVAKLNTPKKIEVIKRVTKTAPEFKEEEVVVADSKSKKDAVKKSVKKTPKTLEKEALADSRAKKIEAINKTLAKVAPKNKKNRSTKVITNPSKTKKAVTTAKPKKKTPPAPKGPTLAEKLRAKAKKDALAAIAAKKEEIKEREFDKKIREDAPKDLEVVKVSYNLSKSTDGNVVKQTRDEYRKNNLRPNGKPYD